MILCVERHHSLQPASKFHSKVKKDSNKSETSLLENLSCADLYSYSKVYKFFRKLHNYSDSLRLHVAICIGSLKRLK